MLTNYYYTVSFIDLHHHYYKLHSNPFQTLSYTFSKLKKNVYLKQVYFIVYLKKILIFGYTCLTAQTISPFPSQVMVHVPYLCLFSPLEKY